ncbi:hypothetical protein [Flammeovirga aprica]|uniref:Uncharacterized protein n=1 Tax=Flammeovirga aprica JL-4 TaxID=694437 RepID=A0A7X9RT48_9BACT|nr:hypothetical protein [Flammeovirga aprica]NME66797.1 hypothetical protein [Flammeovirga aprica JL-4]
MDENANNGNLISSEVNNIVNYWDFIKNNNYINLSYEEGVTGFLLSVYKLNRVYRSEKLSNIIDEMIAFLLKRMYFINEKTVIFRNDYTVNNGCFKFDNEKITMQSPSILNALSEIINLSFCTPKKYKLNQFLLSENKFWEMYLRIHFPISHKDINHKMLWKKNTYDPVFLLEKKIYNKQIYELPNDRIRNQHLLISDQDIWGKLIQLNKSADIYTTNFSYLLIDDYLEFEMDELELQEFDHLIFFRGTEVNCLPLNGAMSFIYKLNESEMSVKDLYIIFNKEKDIEKDDFLKTLLANLLADNIISEVSQVNEKNYC